MVNNEVKTFPKKIGFCIIPSLIMHNIYTKIIALLPIRKITQNTIFHFISFVLSPKSVFYSILLKLFVFIYRQLEQQSHSILGFSPAQSITNTWIDKSQISSLTVPSILFSYSNTDSVYMQKKDVWTKIEKNENVYNT